MKAVLLAATVAVPVHTAPLVVDGSSVLTTQPNTIRTITGNWGHNVSTPPLVVTGVSAGGTTILRIYPDGSFRCVGHPSAKALGELNYASIEALIAYVAMCGKRRHD